MRIEFFQACSTIILIFSLTPPIWAEGSHAEGVPHTAGWKGENWHGNWGLNRTVHSEKAHYDKASAKFEVPEMWITPYAFIPIGGVDSGRVETDSQGNVIWQSYDKTDPSRGKRNIFDCKPTAYLGSEATGCAADIGLQIEWEKRRYPGWAPIFRSNLFSEPEGSPKKDVYTSVQIWSGSALIPWRLSDTVVGFNPNFSLPLPPTYLEYQIWPNGTQSMKSDRFVESQDSVAKKRYIFTIKPTNPAMVDPDAIYCERPASAPDEDHLRVFCSNQSVLSINNFKGDFPQLIANRQWVVFNYKNEEAVKQKYGKIPDRFIKAFPGDIFPNRQMALEDRIASRAEVRNNIDFKRAIGITQQGNKIGTRSGLDGSVMICSVSEAKLSLGNHTDVWSDTLVDQAKTGHDAWPRTEVRPLGTAPAPWETQTNARTHKTVTKVSQPPPFALDGRWTLFGINTDFLNEYETNQSRQILDFPTQGPNARLGVGATEIGNGGSKTRYTTETVATSLRQATRVRGVASKLRSRSYVP